MSITARVYGRVSAVSGPRQRASGWSPHAALPSRPPASPPRGRRRRRGRRDRRRVAHQRRSADPRRGGAVRARRRGAAGPGRGRRGHDPRPPGRGHRGRAPARRARARRRPRPRPPRRPPGQRARRLDRRRQSQPTLEQGGAMSPRLTASLLILAAVLANLAFTALGSIFNYPDVLDEPAGAVLTSFREHQGAVGAWFSVLALSAALLAPIAIGVGRLSSKRAMRIAVPVGIAAAAVQVVGLLRWPLLVPGYASDAAGGSADVAAAARHSFETASDILGTAVGETLGYFLTAVWTALVIAALGRRFAGRWFGALGAASAGLVVVGVLSPLDLPVVDTANFVGYVLWSIWLIAFGVVMLVRARRASPSSASPAAVTS